VTGAVAERGRRASRGAGRVLGGQAVVVWL